MRPGECDLAGILGRELQRSEGGPLQPLQRRSVRRDVNEIQGRPARGICGLDQAAHACPRPGFGEVPPRLDLDGRVVHQLQQDRALVAVGEHPADDTRELEVPTGLNPACLLELGPADDFDRLQLRDRLLEFSLWTGSGRAQPGTDQDNCEEDSGSC